MSITHEKIEDSVVVSQPYQDKDLFAQTLPKDNKEE